MDKEITDQDIKPLIKLTLLTHTSHAVHISIPFFKKFSPSFQIMHDSPAFLPLFNSLRLQTKTEHAQIDLQPLLKHLNEEHVLHIQTYLNENSHVAGSKYALHLQFGQMVVWENQPNVIYVHLKKLGLLPGHGIGHLKPFIKVYATHGSSWTSATYHGQQTIQIDQTMTLMYRSLLDTVTFQVWDNRDKMCECQKFIFELLCTDYQMYSLNGQRFKGQLKIKSTTPLPIVIVD